MKTPGWIVQYDVDPAMHTARTVVDSAGTVIMFTVRGDAVAHAATLPAGRVIPIVRYRRTSADRKREATP